MYELSSKIIDGICNGTEYRDCLPGDDLVCGGRHMSWGRVCFCTARLHFVLLTHINEGHRDLWTGKVDLR